MPRDNQALTKFPPFLFLYRVVTRLQVWHAKSAAIRRRWTSGSGMLWPTVVVIVVAGLIGSVGQLRSLGSALTASLKGHIDYYGGGFAASVGDLFVWWLCCLLLVVACATFSSSRRKALVGENRNAPVSIPERGLLYLVSAMFVMSPLFAAGLDRWQPEVVLSVVMAGVVLSLAPSLGTRYLVLAIGSVIAGGCAVHYEMLEAASAIVMVPALCVVNHKRKHGSLRNGFFWGAGTSFALSAVLVGQIFAGSLLRWQFPKKHFWDIHALLLPLWWLMPGLIVLLACFALRHLDGRRLNLVTLGVVIAAFFVVGNWPETLFGLNTLALLLAAVLSIGNLLRTSRVGVIRRVVMYACLFSMVFLRSEIGPITDLSRSAPVPVSAHASSTFYDFYLKWLKARGETPEDHGPLVFVAVAGGGIRAAAHASIVLSLADDRTGGMFGDRTVMVSGVSGGSLGVATWLAQREDRLPPAENAQLRSGGISPGALALSRFYSNDFLSPVVNRMLLHDLPLAVMPGHWGQADRDVVLRDAWNASWEKLLLGRGVRTGGRSFFRRNMDDISTDGNLPLVVFNATSAADGKGALYSSQAGIADWVWSLDGKTQVADAVLDSARFAGVSPVGIRCAALPGHEIPRLQKPDGFCREGYTPLAVADGGYRDNSGLAEVAVVLEQLARHGDPLDKVFVVQIRSNPEIGLKLVEGSRFDNDSLVPQMLAPAFVLDSARGAHSEAYEQQILSHRQKPHMLVWDLSRQHQMKALISQPPRERWHVGWLDQRANRADLELQLRLPPLGWTIDPDAFERLFSDSLNALEITKVGTCDDLLPQYSTLCKALREANRPVKSAVVSRQ